MTKVDILQGTLDMLVLKTLSHDPMHGFAIACLLYTSDAADE